VSRATFSDLTELAAFCAELVRQGIVFDVAPAATAGFYLVTLTGGY